MDFLQKPNDGQLPLSIEEVGQTLIETGAQIGHKVGSAVSELIDDLVDAIFDE